MRPRKGSSLKVLVISHLYPHPSDPGLGIFVEEQIKDLSSRCQIKVVAPVPWFPPLKLFKKWYAYTRIPSHEVRNGIEVFRPRTIVFPRRILFSLLGFTFFLGLYARVRDIQESFGFDLIHAHTVYPDGFAAALLAKTFNRPLVVTLHGSDVTVNLRRYLWRRLGLWALSNASQVIAVSQALRTTIVDDYGADGDKIRVIPNGVDVSSFAPIPRPEAASKLGLEHQGFRVLYVGAIKKSKGVHHLLNATRGLVEALDDSVELFLVGRGQYEREARLLADELGIASSVRFVGRRPNDEIPLWINACDVAALPSLSEGFGVVLIEAMACGKPVVATRCGGPEDIVNADTGILVPVEDQAALSRALREVLTSERRFDSSKIRQYAIDNYGYDRIGSRIIEVYRHLIGE